MIDDKFVRVFNLNNPERPYTKEQIQIMIDNMPDERVGALFDFVRWVKKELKNKV